MSQLGTENMTGASRQEPSPLGADAAGAAILGAEYQTSDHFVFIVNTDRFFLTHRSSWAVALRSAGGRVTLIAEDTGYAERVKDLGIDFVRAPFGRETIRPFQALIAATTVFAFLLRNRPKTVFMVATAAYTLSWPAAVLLPQTRFVRIIAGAGRALMGDGTSIASRVVRAGLKASSRFSNVGTIFQTTNDRVRFVANGWAREISSDTIPGTGIDVNTWKADEDRKSSNQVVVLFASRLFREKGIYEFIELARRFNDSDARFIVVGRPDTGVESSVTPEDLECWITEGCIEYLGEIDDMVNVYRGADIFVFPSRHPEGTPRVLIEAAACGLALLASDQPGCREVVLDGVTGRLFDPGDEDAIAALFASVLHDADMRLRMSSAARALVVDRYSLDRTLARVFAFIGVPRTDEKAPGTAVGRGQ